MAMSSSLIRWGGLAGLLGTILLVARILLSYLLGPAQGTANPYEIYNVYLFVAYNLMFDTALLLFVVGLVGLYARRLGRSLGWLEKVGLYIAFVGALSLLISAAAAVMVGLLPRLYVPVVYFTQLLAVFCLIFSLGMLGAANTTKFRGWTASLRPRWLLLIVAVGLGAALLSDVLEGVLNSTYLGLKGNHLLHVLVTIPVAAWAARWIGASPVLYGFLIGLVSGIANQVFSHAIMQPGTMSWYEMAVILLSCVAAGCLGGIVARAVLSDQDMLYRISRGIGASTSPREVAEAIGEHLTDPRVRLVALLQEEEEEIVLRAVWVPWEAQSWGQGIWRPGLHLGAAQVPTLANMGKQTARVVRVSKLPEPERAAWEYQGIRSAVLVPLLAPSGARIGLLMVASRRANGFPRIGSYMTIGAQAALALENLRLVEQAQESGVMGERQRLANEIHDTLAQGFTSIVLNLEAAEGMLPPALRSVQQYLDQARSIARESLGEARRLMWALRPESLERAPLPEALARLAERWSGECGVDASVNVTGAPRSLPPEIEVTLLRVGQEALSNCRKHARASHVVLSLSYMKNLIALNVQDDGVGFDPDGVSTAGPGPQSTGGFGLMGMRERVEKMRGTLMVQSAPGEGSTLMVAVPVSAEAGATNGAQTANPVGERTQ